MWRITGFAYPVRSSQVSAKSSRKHSVLIVISSPVADSEYRSASSDEIRRDERRWKAGMRMVVESFLGGRSTISDLRFKRWTGGPLDSPSRSIHLNSSDSRERLLDMSNRKASVLIFEGMESRSNTKEKKVRFLTCVIKVF